MKIIFKFLYDYGLYDFLFFMTIGLFIFGILINRHYVGFGINHNTYSSELLMIDSIFTLPIGSGRGSAIGIGYINGNEVNKILKQKLPLNKTVPVWYSPNLCATMDVLTRKDGESFMEVKKRLMYKFLRCFLVLNMPLLLSVYYYRKLKTEEKSNNRQSEKILPE